MNRPMVKSAATTWMSTALRMTIKECHTKYCTDHMKAPLKSSSRLLQKNPEQKLLSRVVASCRWHLVVLIRTVILHRLPPCAIYLRVSHLFRPHAVHEKHRSRKNQPGPRMQHARHLSAAQNNCDPEAPRRPERQSRQQQIHVRKSRHPMHQTLAKRVPQDVSVRDNLFLLAHGRPPAWMSSSSRAFGPNRR